MDPKEVEHRMLAHRARRVLARDPSHRCNTRHRQQLAQLMIAQGSNDETIASASGLDLATVIWLRLEIKDARKGRRLR